MKQYDLIVIGAGPGGYVAALRAAKLGASVAVVEDREPGGTCLNRGCIPTKAMLHSSQIYHDIRCGGPCGVRAENVSIDMEALMTRTREITAKLSAGVEALLKAAKVDLFRGKGVITAPDSVQVTGEQEATLAADRILAATGSVPARPPIPGLDLPGVLTSDDLLRSAQLYDSLIIMGGGVIGVEFATFYNDLG
ncbi:MAG: NAD(P)/FAD-dependent oxidoreductase, partial [Firmicutes bacterium]|nr:NAD(P)/FAD-dependent oxidoreductase [Bacillota bacterium]